MGLKCFIEVLFYAFWVTNSRNSALLWHMLEFTKIKAKKTSIKFQCPIKPISNKTVCLCMFTPFQARNKVTEIINKAITHYRDDIDLQNLIDFGQREVKIWSSSKLHRTSLTCTGLNRSLTSWMFMCSHSLAAVVALRSPTGPTTCTSTAARRTPVRSAALSPSPAALWQKARWHSFFVLHSLWYIFLPEHEFIFFVTVE